MTKLYLPTHSPTIFGVDRQNINYNGTSNHEYLQAASNTLIVHTRVPIIYFVTGSELKEIKRSS